MGDISINELLQVKLTESQEQRLSKNIQEQLNEINKRLKIKPIKILNQPEAKALNKSIQELLETRSRLESKIQLMFPNVNAEIIAKLLTPLPINVNNYNINRTLDILYALNKEYSPNTVETDLSFSTIDDVKDEDVEKVKIGVYLAWIHAFVMPYVIFLVQWYDSNATEKQLIEIQDQLNQIIEQYEYDENNNKPDIDIEFPQNVNNIKDTKQV
ncbi:hypothetical protein FZC66_00610 [Priestia megaterium]|nr:hypothetical protein FZC66_00610 [Priestia megaterium]